MALPELPDIDVAPATFDALYAAELVALKQNFDRAGNLVGPQPLAAIASQFTAEWGNLIDGLLLVVRARLGQSFRSVLEDGAVLDGVADDTDAIQAAIDAMSAAGGGVVLVPVGTPSVTALTIPDDVRLVHVCEGTPESARYGNPGSLAFRVDGSTPLYEKSAGTNTTGWVVHGAAPSRWTERYLGDLIAAPDEDLAATTNPTVEVANDTETAGQVASCEWTSNHDDATGATAQGVVTSFATDASGLTMVGAAFSSNFTATAHNAAHIWTSWAELLGEDPRPGVEYCVQIYVPSNDIATASEYVGIGCYAENDGAGPTDIVGSTAKIDEKRIVAAIGQFAAVPGAAILEGSTGQVAIGGSRLPAGYNCVALIFRSGVMVEGALGVYEDDTFPEPDAMVRIDTWLGSASFSAGMYLDAQDRVAIVFQQQAGSFTASVAAVRVLSRE
jgi:hypothetical protein